MKLDDFIEILKERLETYIKNNVTGRIIFEVNLSQGGIGVCKEIKEAKINDNRNIYKALIK